MSWAEDMGYDMYDLDDIYYSAPKLELLVDPDELRLFWKTKDGSKIFLEDMETSHIESIIRLTLNGKMQLTTSTEDRFLLELSLRRRRPEIVPATINNLGF